VSHQLFDPEIRDDAPGNAASEGKHGVVQVVYLAAIGVATIGWLWLIAWCALQLA
jgi:hypothetical protein